MLLFDWVAACATGPVEAGGKGWNLGRLHRYGFPVPAGGVVSAEGYRRFMSHPELAAATADLGRLCAAEAVEPEAAAALKRLRGQILATPLPPDLAAELSAFLATAGLHDRPVAVRSSATAEDSATASFAGIHQSFLNVTGAAAVVEAVKGCYASLWTPRAVAYRRRLKLSDEAVAAAVVILAMVNAQAAGVCFTCDPRTGRRDRFAVSASPGLGEALVSGAADPDEYMVDVARYPPDILSRRIAHKVRISVPKAGGGTELITILPANAGEPALANKEVIRLALLAARVHDALGDMDRPQDIEWAHDGKQFWLLQARPVTHLPEPSFPAIAGQPVIWSNANLRDVVPGVMSTLNWSFLRHGMEILLTTPLKDAGWLYEGGINWIRLFRGRAYFNLTAMHWAFFDALGMNPAEFNQVIGGHQPESALPAPTFSDRTARELRRLRTIRQTFRTMKAAPALFLRYFSWAEQAEALPMDTWTQDQFLRFYREASDRMYGFMPQFQTLNGAAGAFHSELIKMLRPAFGDRAPGLVNAMLAGSQGITSAEQGHRLVQLGNLALQEPPARAWFTEADWTPAQWQQRLAGTQWERDFAAYLRDYGHRGVYEVEILNPRWIEDPSYLLQIVRSQVRSGREIRLEGQREKREGAMREVFGRLRYTPKGLQARFYQKQAGIAAAYREMGKSVLVKLLGVIRYCSVALGRQMAAAGLLGAPDEIFHLAWPDVEAYLSGHHDGRGFRALVADRRVRREEQLAQQPPDVIIGETPVKRAPAGALDGAVLLGTGVAAGRAAGAARVILHPDEGARLQPGEVLVAPSTDPAWTPLFLRASAVVMEIGGYLSHGAIVAREYGLPAVANIPGLLQVVRDGEVLAVDGDAGKVYR
ncbi:MAG TPA: PEP/pyruvate-binding domain-containing protein [Symbiobacteriaceae bacterium]|nr:PEP/pyruvate-binding domain-containing protein [Symbiobacteriaceae bacterium]